MSASQTDIIATLTELLTGQLAEPVAVAPDTDLISDLALESVQIMEFMVEVEDHYDIAISLEALAEIRNLDQLARLITTILDAQ
ncbi:MAG: acyl carrier protein [Pseudomonadales bacterium]|nr:acyl carrier protein [Pseudomonadales bacterium]NIX09229.1 acyl carrier protein [Pseudomonadales bacterium]